MEIAAEVLRYILQYLGWDEDEIEEVLGERRRTASRGRSVVRRIGSGMPSFKMKRSIVREIGSRLPLTPCKKPYFQLTFDSRPHAIIQEEERGPEEKPWSSALMATLADIGQLISVQNGQASKIQETEEQLSTFVEEQKPEEEMKTSTAVVNDDTSAIAKISALEEELQKLREQISLLVTAPQNQQPMGIPCAPAGAPAPPPPPPPPPPTPLSTPIKPIAQIIRENRAKNRQSGVPGFDKPQNVPDMADVLKGLGTVKLRSVESKRLKEKIEDDVQEIHELSSYRSPGGTPRRLKPLSTQGTDPASIIAQALKKKFAHRRFQEAGSPDANKENSPRSSFSPSSPSSPQIPFGPHLLKSSKSRRRSSPRLTSKRRSSESHLVQIIC